jgi:hypothetical protein
MLLVATAVLLFPQAASSQLDAPPYGRRYDDGYRRPPPPPPPGYREERRYHRERPPQVYRQPRGIFCAREGGYCRFQGPAVVRYGAGGRFTSRRAFDGIPCNNSVFGDPFVGADKACYID